MADNGKMQKIEFIGPYESRRHICTSERDKPADQMRMPGTGRETQRCFLDAVLTVWFSWGEGKVLVARTIETRGAWTDPRLLSAVKPRDEVKAATYSGHIDEMPKLTQNWFDEVSVAARAAVDAFMSTGPNYSARVYDAAGEVWREFPTPNVDELATSANGAASVIHEFSAAAPLPEKPKGKKAKEPVVTQKRKGRKALLNELRAEANAANVAASLAEHEAPKAAKVIKLSSLDAAAKRREARRSEK